MAWQKLRLALQRCHYLRIQRAEPHQGSYCLQNKLRLSFPQIPLSITRKQAIRVSTAYRPKYPQKMLVQEVRKPLSCSSQQLDNFCPDKDQKSCKSWADLGRQRSIGDWRDGVRMHKVSFLDRSKRTTDLHVRKHPFFRQALIRLRVSGLRNSSSWLMMHFHPTKSHPSHQPYSHPCIHIKIYCLKITTSSPCTLLSPNVFQELARVRYHCICGYWNRVRCILPFCSCVAFSLSCLLWDSIGLSCLDCALPWSLRRILFISWAKRLLQSGLWCHFQGRFNLKDWQLNILAWNPHLYRILAQQSPKKSWRFSCPSWA